MAIQNQDDIYYSVKFISDNSGLTDQQLVSQLTADLTGNPYSNGVIGILLKYRNPEFDTSTYQTDMNVIINLCTEFLLLRYRKLFDYISIVKFLIKMIELSNIKYIYSVLAYLLKINLIYRMDNGDYDLFLTVNNNYLTLSSQSIPAANIPLNTNIINNIQPVVYNSDSKVIFLRIILNNTSSSNTVTVSITQGMFLLYPLQMYTLSWATPMIMVDSPCEIDLLFFSSDMNNFLYTSSILAKFQ